MRILLILDKSYPLFTHISIIQLSLSQNSEPFIYVNMKKIKRIITLLGFVILMILASVGMGIAGAAPIMPINKREDAVVINIEEDEPNDSKTDFRLIGIKS